MPDPLDNQMEEFERRWADTPEEERPQPPGFEDEQVESDKDKPTLVVEEIKAEKIETQDTGGGEDFTQMDAALSRIVELLTDIRNDQRDGFFLD